MSTPLLDRTTISPSKGTVSPPDTYPHQLRPVFPTSDGIHYSNPSSFSIDTGAEGTALQSASVADRAEELVHLQEKKVGVKFANNPNGTILTTIVERGSNATLLVDDNVSQLPERVRAEQDAAALSEFRNIMNSRLSESASEHVGLGEQAAIKNDLAAQSTVLEDVDASTCLPNHRSSSDGPNVGHRIALGQESTKSRQECSSPKHLFHIFPDFIQLGSISQPENSRHVQTSSTKAHLQTESAASQAQCQHNGNSETSDDSVGTRYLPVDFISSPPSHTSRRHPNSSSVSSRSLGKSSDEFCSSKSKASTNGPRRGQGSSGQTSYESPLDEILEGYDDALMQMKNPSNSPTPCATNPPMRTPSTQQPHHHRQSASSSHETGGTFQTSTRSTHTFRSAALESLLPIAAAEGIIVPCTLTPHTTTQVRAASNPTTPFETSHAELSVLYHRGDVCRHRASAYAAAGIEPQDTLLQMLEAVSVDGAVEIRERKDLCWRCRAEKQWKQCTGLAMSKGCCFFGVEKADEVERARLVDV